MEIEHLTDERFKEVLKNEGVVLVDFFATWCPPCKMLSPILEDMSKEATNFAICKLDIDEAIDTANEYGVMSVPTMIIFKDGIEKDRLVGFRRKEQIMDAINSCIE